MFMLKMYSENDETDILEVLDSEIFFVAQPWWENFLQNSLKVFSMDFTIQWWYL